MGSGSFIIMKGFIFGKIIKDKHHRDICQSLHKNEIVLLRIQQSRLFGSLFNPVNAYVTSSRFIIRYSCFLGLIPGLTISLNLFEILFSAQERNLFFSSFTVETRFRGRTMGISKIPHSAAAELEKHCRWPFQAEKLSLNPESPYELAENNQSIEYNPPLKSIA